MSTVQELQRELYSDYGTDRIAFTSRSYPTARYVIPAAKEVGDYFARLGAPPYFGGTKIEVDRLPTLYACAIKVAGNRIRIVPLRPVGKVFGSYDPDLNQITLDKGVVWKDDKERRSLERFGIVYPPDKDVAMHELAHAAQKNVGVIKKYVTKFGENVAREYIEGSATRATAEILQKNMREYPREQKVVNGLIENYGKKAVMLGDIPSSAARYAARYRN